MGGRLLEVRVAQPPAVIDPQSAYLVLVPPTHQLDQGALGRRFDGGLQAIDREGVAIDRQDFRIGRETGLEGRSVPDDLGDVAVLAGRERQSDREAKVGELELRLGALEVGLFHVGIDEPIPAAGQAIQRRAGAVAVQPLVQERSPVVRLN